jgi:ArsR family transcriptional regulator
MAERGWGAEASRVGVLKSRLNHHDADVVAEAVRALADSARLQILGAIGAAGSLNVTDVMKFVDISQPTVSHHLKVLSEAGFLKREKRGTVVFYALVPERFAALAEFFAVPRRAKPAAKTRRHAV